MQNLIIITKSSKDTIWGVSYIKLQVLLLETENSI